MISITFCPESELTIILRGVVEFLTISHHISSRSWAAIVLQGVVEFLTISHHISSRLWADHCLARCYWISDHLTSHFVQGVSPPSSCKVLLNFWPSHITFCPDSELTVILQGVFEFLTISHHILSREWVDCRLARCCWSSDDLYHISSRSWVDHCLARCCWIFDHLTSHFVQFVSWLLSCKVMLNFWPSCITFCPGSESTVIL